MKLRSNIITSRSKSEFWGTLDFTAIFGVFAFIGIATLIQGLAVRNLWVLLNLTPIGAAAYFSRKIYLARRTLRLERHVALFNEARAAWVGTWFLAQIATKAGHLPEQFEAWLEHFIIVRRDDSERVHFEKVVDRRLSGSVEDMGAGKARVFVDIPQNFPATTWADDEQCSWWDLVISMRISGKKVLM